MKALIIGLLATLVFSAACTHQRAGSASAAAGQEDTYLVVDNLQTQSFTIYVTDGARRVRLGTAPPLRKTRMAIPRAVIFPAVQLQFLAQPQGNDPSPVSEQIAVSPGDVIGVQIGP